MHLFSSENLQNKRLLITIKSIFCFNMHKIKYIKESSKNEWLIFCISFSGKCECELHLEVAH